MNINSFCILPNNLLSLFFNGSRLGLRKADDSIFNYILNHLPDFFSLVIVLGLLSCGFGLFGVSHLHLRSKVTSDLLKQLLKGTALKVDSSQQEILDKLVLLDNFLGLPLHLLLQGTYLLGLDTDLTFQGILQGSQLILEMVFIGPLFQGGYHLIFSALHHFSCQAINGPFLFVDLETFVFYGFVETVDSALVVGDSLGHLLKTKSFHHVFVGICSSVLLLC